MSNFVPGIGPPDAKIVLIGEAPGADEDQSGIPFSGSSGRLLNSMLANSGIDRSQCYLTNVHKWRPNGNDFDTLYLDGPKRRQASQTLLDSIASLKAEIATIRPNIIVPLDNEALRAITGKLSIESWRGSLLSTTLGKVCGTYHPAYVLRQYSSRTTVELDFRRIAIEAKSPTLTLPKHDFTLRPSFDQVISYLSQRPKRLAFDIETTGSLVRCLGLSDRADRAICIPFMCNRNEATVTGGVLNLTGNQNNNYWTEEQEYEIIHRLNILFNDRSVEKIAQNWPFDSVVLARNFGLDCQAGFYMDTMVAQHTCYSELPKGLDYLASVYTRVPYYSDHDSGVDSELWLYNCFDAAITIEISYKLEEELKQLKLWDFYFNRVHPCIAPYVRAEMRGILTDTTVRNSVRITTEQELASLKQRIPITNPNSDKQVKDYLYGTLKLPPVLHHKTKAVTSDKNAIATLRNKHPQHEKLFNDLESYSQKSTLLTFLDRGIDETGRARTHYNITGTVTGRLSSGKDKERGSIMTEGAFGLITNLQNILRGEFRRMFIADPNWLLVKSDLSQAEFRIVVWKARIQRIIDKYISDPYYDIHRYIASLIFNKAETEISKAERSTAKNGVYGGQYGMWYVTAARTYRLDINMARYVLDRFHTEFPEIKSNFWKAIINDINTTRCVTNPLGRKRFFFGRMEDSLYRDAYSQYAQSTVGDIINRAFVEGDKFDADECYPLLQVHDEIVWAVREGLERQYIPRIKQIMEVPLLIHNDLPPLVIPTEILVGKNWHDVKQLETV